MLQEVIPRSSHVRCCHQGRQCVAGFFQQNQFSAVRLGGRSVVGCNASGSGGQEASTSACKPARDDQDAHLPNHKKRRLILIQGGMCLPELATSSAAAERMLEDAEGRTVSALELNCYLRVVALKGSVPRYFVDDYKGLVGPHAGMKMSEVQQLQGIFTALQKPARSGKETARTADVVTVGDRWLGQAVREGLVQPIPNAPQYRWWRSLGSRWQHLVWRTADGFCTSSGNAQVWAAPYRWGGMAVAWRKDKLLTRRGRAIEDWQDLLQLELNQRLAMPTDSHQLLAIAARTLGAASFNPSPATLQRQQISAAMLKERARALYSQVRLFTDDEHTKALMAGDVWAAVGWAQDLAQLATRTTNVVVTVPRSGTILWADLWGVPIDSQGSGLGPGVSPLLPLWLEMALLPARASPDRPQSKGYSPLLLPELQLGPPPPPPPTPKAAASVLSVVLRADQLPPADVLARSDFLHPLDSDTRHLFQDVLASLPRK